MTYSDTDGTIRRRSGWLIPLGVFLVTAVLSALLLLFYLAPAPTNFLEEQVSPTARADLIALRVHGLKLWIPANYLQFDSARQGGAQKDVALFALLPGSDIGLPMTPARMEVSNKILAVCLGAAPTLPVFLAIRTSCRVILTQQGVGRKPF